MSEMISPSHHARTTVGWLVIFYGILACFYTIAAHISYHRNVEELCDRLLQLVREYIPIQTTYPIQFPSKVPFKITTTNPPKSDRKPQQSLLTSSVSRLGLPSNPSNASNPSGPSGPSGGGRWEVLGGVLGGFWGSKAGFHRAELVANGDVMVI
jgi:hypothetical protein